MIGSVAELDGPLLGVNRSLCGHRWVGPDPSEDRLALALAQTTGLPDLVARVLARRAVAPAAAAAYLAPTLRDLMPDPATLADMDRATERLVAAVAARERIAIFADYDVDGAASATLLIRWLRALGLESTLYVPQRIEEGYGPNEPAMAALGRTHDLIVCVDCGTLSHGPIAAAGADVLVIDHHQAGPTLPPAVAIVNPNRSDDASGLGYLCAAGVVFLVLVNANRRLREGGAAPPDLLPLLDLVALATVADVVPLRDLNRAFVRQGLQVMRGGSRPAIAALAASAALGQPPGVHTLGFVFGPRVNAGGRVGASDLGARLLATDDPDEAAALAERLEALNRTRRAVEMDVRLAAERQAASRGTDGSLVWAAGEGWHPGVVGIVAARLKETFGRPAVVIALGGGEGRGSGRSVEGVDLGAAVQQLVREGLATKGGGHASAAGLSIVRDALEPAMERLGELLAQQGARRTAQSVLRVDGMLAASSATIDLIDQIEAAGPYGAASPQPRVVLPHMRVASARLVGSGHLALDLAGEQGARLGAMAFGCAGTALGAALRAGDAGRLHVAGRLEADSWNGRRRVRLLLEDAAAAGRP